MSEIELGPVTSITAAAVGEPGNRTFYLQAKTDAAVVSLLLEKQQVALLAAHLDELLERVGVVEADDPEVPDPDGLDLAEPVEPEFRIGQIGLGYERETDRVMIQCEELVAEDDPVPDPRKVRIWTTRPQAFALARRGEREVGGGRPVCSMCGEPIDPEGHFCARSNGHREVGEIG